MGHKHNLFAAALDLHPAAVLAPHDKPRPAAFRRLSWRRFAPLAVMAALVLLGMALAYGTEALRAALSARNAYHPLAHEKYLPIGSRQLTVAIVPLQPSAAVLAVTGMKNKGRAEAAARLTDSAGLQALGANLAGLYPFSYTVSTPMELPDSYFDFERKQYRIDLILDWLVERHDPQHFRTIGVLPVDVYKPEYNFLFGLAKIYGPACVASSARMASPLPLARLQPQQRWHSILRHEFGHALGLQHINARSVMRYSDNLLSLDHESNVLTPGEWERLKQLHPIRWDFTDGAAPKG